MAVYTSANAGSSITSVELSTRPDGSYAFFHVKKPEDLGSLKAKLVGSGLNMELLSQEPAGNEPLLVMRSFKTDEQVLKALKAQGEELRVVEPPREFHPWKWRGNFSNFGQGLTLASSLAKGNIQKDKLAFSAFNLTANGINVIFGGQKEEDVHRLRQVKEQFCALLTPYLPSGTSLPVVDEKPAALVRAQAKEKPRSIGQKAYDFMQRNSVTVGELGLRYVGALAMVFPAEQWKAVGAELRSGAVMNAFKKAVNSNPDKTNLNVGIRYLIGKTVGLFAKVPDPYNPEPPSQLDMIREKVLFRASSVIEATAAGTLAYGSYKKGDMVGSLGGVSLVSGLSTRVFAKFGSKEVDMEELYAYVAEGLAKVPAAALPKAMAQTAGFLKDHFEDKHLRYGDIYLQLRSDLYRYHAIAVHPQGNAQAQDASTPIPAESKWVDKARPGEPPAAMYTRRVQQQAGQEAAVARG